MKRYKILSAILAAAACTLSCSIDIDEYKASDPDAGTALKVSSPVSGKLVLDERESENTALELNWTAGSNYGTGNAIEYTIEIIRDGVEEIYSENLGRRVYSTSFTHKALNGILTTILEAAPGEETEYVIRVTASVTDYPEFTQTSEMKMTISTYIPVSQTLFLLTGSGDNWDPSSAIEMVRTSDGVFTYESMMEACEFRLTTVSGQLWPAYLNSGDTEGGNAVYCSEAPEGEAKNFAIAEKSMYRIDVNLLDLTVTVTDILPERLYIFGSATAGGWTPEDASEMTAGSGKGIFTWTGTLLGSGEFKFITSRSFWPGFVKATADEDDYSIIYSATELPAEQDLKFRTGEDGTFEVKVDILDLTVSFRRTGEAVYENLYIIGDATSGGWALENAGKMEEISDGVYKWSGQLGTGEFRFVVSTAGYAPGYWKANDAPEDMGIIFSDALLGGDDDRTFTITEAGGYIITADTENLVVTIDRGIEHLYMIGGATPGGWELSARTEMDKTGDWTFSWTGELKADTDGFKFITSDDWWPGYVNDGSGNLAYYPSDPGSAADLKFTVDETAVYKVDADLNAMTLKVNKQ